MGVLQPCLLLCALLVPLAGCQPKGPKLSPVEGVITLNGEPLVGALVEFQPLIGTGTPSYGDTDEDGHYELMFSQKRSGALVCEHLVRISTFNENERVREKLPHEYHSHSEIQREVVGRTTNVFNFAIETESK